MQIPEGDRYWLAGLLEGEGYFGIHTVHHNNGRTYRNAELSVKMVDSDVVSRAMHVMGINRRLSTTLLPSGKTAYSIRITGEKAIEIMRAILPLMGMRRAQKINAVLDFWENRGQTGL